MNNQKTFTLKLKSIKPLAPQVKHFVFTLPSGTSMPFIPGQFISLHLPFKEKVLRRSYSLANSPQHAMTENQLELAAAYVPQGVASDFLFALQPNDTVEATGPFGRLILREEQPQRYLLVATGTGVTPYRSMLDELAKRMAYQTNLQVTLLLGVRSPEEALYHEEFTAFANQHPRFQFQVYYSRSIPASHLPYEFQGRVTSALPQLQLSPENDVVYLCGNPNMIDDAFTWLVAQGFATDKIRREKYISSK